MMKRLLGRGFLGLVTLTAGYLVLLAYPQPLFAYELTHAGLTVHADRPVPADRPLSYFIAHELMHIAAVRRVGPQRYARLPQWVDDGYADYVAKDIDLKDTLAKFKKGARELDPARSGLYLRYHLMVAYLLDQKGVSIDALLASPPARDALERELHALTGWP